MEDQEESGLKTPSVAASLSLKDSHLTSMTGKNDQVLTPTMQTIHSKEPSDDSNSGLAMTLALNEQITGTMDERVESQTVSTFNITANVTRSGKGKGKKSKKNMVSWHPTTEQLEDDDEEKLMGDISSVMVDDRKQSKRRKRKRGRRTWNEAELVLPTSSNMTENIKQCFERRDRLLIESDDSPTSSSSEDNRMPTRAEMERPRHNAQESSSSITEDIQLQTEELRQYEESGPTKSLPVDTQ